MFGRVPSWVIAMVSVLAAIGAWSIHAQAPANDFDKWWTPQNEALAAAPQHHTLLFENDEVRVLTVTIAPSEECSNCRIARALTKAAFDRPLHLRMAVEDALERPQGSLTLASLVQK